MSHHPTNLCFRGSSTLLILENEYLTSGYYSFREQVKMPTVFGNEERGFYNAFFIQDAKRRRSALDKWEKTTAQVIQDAVIHELDDFVGSITANRWTDDEWKNGEEKLRQLENDFHLVMDIKLRKLASNERYRGTLPEPAVRIKIGSDVKRTEIRPEYIMSKTEIDLHGMTVDEASFHVGDFLEDCYKTNEKVVWIIHGKGTGALREAVRKLLSENPLVKSFSMADSSHGGEGAMQILLKKH